MSGIQISSTFNPPFTVRLDWMFTLAAGDNQDYRLANLVIIALNTDRRALPTDTLPQLHSDDLRGWWGDTNAKQIWGGWPIGTRLWTMTRDKITTSAARQGSTVEKARRFIKEALDPIVQARIASKYDIALQQVGIERISGGITIYRGPKSAIALNFQDLWSDFGG